MSAASTAKRRRLDDEPGSNFQTELSRGGGDESSLAGDASRRERRKRRRVNDARKEPASRLRAAPLVLTAVHDHVRTLEVSLLGVAGAKFRFNRDRGNYERFGTSQIDVTLLVRAIGFN
jgi:hypothetical protein